MYERENNQSIGYRAATSKWPSSSLSRFRPVAKGSLTKTAKRGHPASADKNGFVDRVASPPNGPETSVIPNSRQSVVLNGTGLRVISDQ